MVPISGVDPTNIHVSNGVGRIFGTYNVLESVVSMDRVPYEISWVEGKLGEYLKNLKRDWLVDTTIGCGGKEEI